MVIQFFLEVVFRQVGWAPVVAAGAGTGEFGSGWCGVGAGRRPWSSGFFSVFFPIGVVMKSSGVVGTKGEVDVLE